VRAHIRHTETPYDQLLAQGEDRAEARNSIAHLVDAVASRWSVDDHVQIVPIRPP
jgi:hypothetical protein